MHDNDFHSGARPLESLQGGMDMVHTQQPMTSENSGDTGGNTMTPCVEGWNTTSLAPSAGMCGANDKNKAH